MSRTAARMFIAGMVVGFLFRSWLPSLWWHSFRTVSFFLFFAFVFWLYGLIGKSDE